MPTQRHHNKPYSQLTSGSCLMRDASHYLSDPRITMMCGRLSQIPPRRGNCVSEFYNGSCQSLVQQHHDKILNATDFHPGDINWRDSEDENDEAICDELVRHHAQHEPRNPKEYFDSEDEGVQRILSQSRDTLGVGRLYGT